MIYHYKHKSIHDLTPQELDLLGYEGVYQYAQDHNIPPEELFQVIKKLETDIKQMGNRPFDMSHGKNLDLMNSCVDKYIKYFNKNATYDKQAYIILGNIASGKSTYAKSIEEPTNSIIIDPDRFKMGEDTPNGYFEGFTSLYEKGTDRERLQDPCSDASKKVLANVSDLGMNLIMPKATTSLEKLEKQIQCLIDKNYDVHLIMFESPIQDCANRNYFRYIVKQYSQILINGRPVHGRFVPVSVITNIGDGTFTTFAKAYKKGNFKTYKAFFNRGFATSKDVIYKNDEIDLPSMQI